MQGIKIVHDLRFKKFEDELHSLQKKVEDIEKVRPQPTISNSNTVPYLNQIDEPKEYLKAL